MLAASRRRCCIMERPCVLDVSPAADERPDGWDFAQPARTIIATTNARALMESSEVGAQ